MRREAAYDVRLRRGILVHIDDQGRTAFVVQPYGGSENSWNADQLDGHRILDRDDGLDLRMVERDFFRHPCGVGTDLETEHGHGSQQLAETA